MSSKRTLIPQNTFEEKSEGLKDLTWHGGTFL